MPPVLQMTPRGLYCAAGDLYIDPTKAVPRAIITHAHSDHARPGHGRYLCSATTLPLLHARLGHNIRARGVPFGEVQELLDARVSLHPAGHILGSSQVRVEVAGEVWVASGDYKRDPDPSCEPFEPVPCDTFITEATFALPIYVWPQQDTIGEQILAWWDHNRAQGRPSLIACYALGKAQRILASLAPLTDRFAVVHSAIEPLNALYREAGIRLLPTRKLSDLGRRPDLTGALILAPPNAIDEDKLARLGDPVVAAASGWLRVRALARQRSMGQGFVLSDHADWPGLLRTIEQTGARRVLVTHGDSAVLVRTLRARGLECDDLEVCDEAAG
jgi:putative mRNA 3-end processing factor